MGVYQVRNTVNGKLLVGASVDLPTILNRHRAELRMGGHRNRELQKDWAEFGQGRGCQSICVWTGDNRSETVAYRL